MGINLTELEDNMSMRVFYKKKSSNTLMVVLINFSRSMLIPESLTALRCQDGSSTQVFWGKSSAGFVYPGFIQLENDQMLKTYIFPL